MARPDERLQKWASEQLAALLSMPADSCGEIVENILEYDNAKDLKEFLGAFAEGSAEKKVNSFVEELFRLRKNPAGAPSNASQPNRSSVPSPEPEARGRGNSKGGRGGRESKGRGRGAADIARSNAEAEFPRMLMPTQPRDQADKRLIVIDAASGRHKVLTNCLNCGKVIVEAEGWGPCLFCGNPLEVSDRFGVRHMDDRGFLDNVEFKTKQEEEQYNESFEKAKSTKDRLLSYDRDAKKRTKVYDDSTDWFSESVNPWLNEKQREDAMRQANEEDRRQREERRRIHAKIDLFGRTVIDASAEVEAQRKAKDKEVFQNWTENVAENQRLLSMYEQNKGLGQSQLSGESQQLYDRLRSALHASGKNLNKRPNGSEWGTNYDDEDEHGGKRKEKSRWDASIDADRIGNEFSESSALFGSVAATNERLLPAEESPYGDADDRGQCLSMHQPWASLLVHGFKRAEGRMWKTDHRGRLWIHAAGKPPEKQDIQDLEKLYRDLYSARGVPIPPMPSEGTGYPTSALLGCVDLEVCWSQKEYSEVLAKHPSMPQEQNDNDYIFWCLRPRRLPVPVKMGGDSKLWRLPLASLTAWQAGIQPVRWPAPSADGETSLVSPELPDRPRPASASEPRNNSDSSAGARMGDSLPPLLDLWPREKATELLQVVDRDRGSTDRDFVVLQNGFVHLVGFVSPELQQRIVDELREIGLPRNGGFFEEHFDGIKTSTGTTRMYLGKHWNSASQCWESTRSNIDGASVRELPKMLADIYSEAVKRANRELKTPQHKKRKLTPFAEGSTPGLGVVNFYAPGGSMQMHQDTGESQASIDAGLPVVGICIGDTCDFNYSVEAPSSSKNKPKSLRLESGDVYIFGGESRLLWHGVGKILPRTAPPSLRLAQGRLSVSLRAA